MQYVLTNIKPQTPLDWINPYFAWMFNVVYSNQMNFYHLIIVPIHYSHF